MPLPPNPDRPGIPPSPVPDPTNSPASTSLGPLDPLRLALDRPDDPKPMDVLHDYARGQRQRGETMVTNSGTLASLRRFLGVAVAQTESIRAQLTTIDADERAPSDRQQLTPRARGEQRQAVDTQLRAKLEALIGDATKQISSLYKEFDARELPELRDLTISVQDSAKVTMVMTQVQTPHLRPQDFLAICWSAIRNLDTPVAVALYPIVKASMDDPRYQAFADRTPTRRGDPLQQVLDAIDLLRARADNHAARIVRDIVPRLREDIGKVVTTLSSPPYVWPEFYNTRRADGLLAITPELDPLSGNAPARVIDDPQRYEFSRPPFPVLYG